MKEASNNLIGLRGLPFRTSSNLSYLQAVFAERLEAHTILHIWTELMALVLWAMFAFGLVGPIR